MASMFSVSVATLIPSAPRFKSTTNETVNVTLFGGGGQRLVPKIQLSHGTNFARLPSFKNRISCSAKPETLIIVRSIIATQLSLDESKVTPETKFSDMGADSLDTAEILMMLETQFEVSIEGGIETIVTVQDAADLVEKVKIVSFS